MNITCICPTQPPPYFKYVLNAITFISFPVNIFGTCLFWYNSTANYKYCLVYYQIIAFLAENWSSFVSPGYYFFPMIGGINYSFIGSRLSAHTSAVIWNMILGFELPSLVLCFIYRHTSVITVNKNKSPFRHVNYFALIMCHIFPCLIAYLLYQSGLSFEQKIEFLTKDYPECLHFALTSRFAVYDLTYNNTIISFCITVILFVFIFSTYAFGLAFHAAYYLKNLRLLISTETFKTHKILLFTLTMQCVLPSTFLLIPLITVSLVIIYGLIDLQEISNDSIFLISSHSCFTTLVMIFSNSRYRNLILKYLKCKKRRRSKIIRIL